MKIGLFGIGSGPTANAAAAKQVASAADELGLDSLWTGEHVVLPTPQQPPSPAPPEFPMLHPSTCLSYLAAITEKIKLGTGITLIAQRNPLVLAKEMSSLDVLSKGRLILGIGAGYLHQEFAALGIPFHERGARTDEYLAALKILWNEKNPEFKGKFVNFSSIQAMPRPLQAGGPEIVVGGTSDAALARAARSAEGWYGFALNPEQTRLILKRLRNIEGGAELEISVTPAARIDEKLISEFAEIGVHRLISLMPNEVGRIFNMLEQLSKL